MSGIIGGPVTPRAPKKYALSEIEAIMGGGLVEGEYVACIFVPSRTFRVAVSEEDRKFKVQQRDMKTNKWLTLSLHTGVGRWEAWGAAWQWAVEAQKKFLLEMRRAKINHKRMVQHMEEGRL